MVTLLDQVREALAPEYQVERELASGGMGVVYLGRDVSLDRRVAIKIIRPDLATATAAERFVREARVLASLSHPNIVPVHRAGESRGLFYYVMDYLEAETLAGRLSQGPLTAGDAVALAKDVLAALETAHRRGIVHRDVKPGNVFLLEGRAVLGDFGIAKATTASEAALTADGKVVGSPGHMAPEQLAGADVTPATDLYAVGLLLYEALTGENWPFLTEPAGADWSRVPHALVPVLIRALAWSPSGRWHSAAEFRRALEAPRGLARGRRLRRAAVVIAAVAVAAVALNRSLFPVRHGVATLQIHVLPFTVQPLTMRWLADSLPAAVVRGLRGAPDFAAAVAPDSGDGRRPGLALRGSADVLGSGTLRLSMRSDTALSGSVPIELSTRGPVAQWEQLAESLDYELLLAIWTGRGGRIAADLPLRALPHTRDGVIAWTQAERLFARAQWEAAYDAYRQALRVDPTCLLCRVRLTDVARWLDRDQDATETARYRAAVDSFPPHYRRLIEASFAPHDEKLALLRDITDRYREFGLAWFIYADELFHRGPLDGYSRREGFGAMRRATIAWPDFAPGWEHLAWIAIALGDSTAARRALDSLYRFGVGGDRFEASIRAFLEAGYRWRFRPSQEAARYTDALLRSPEVAGYSSLSAGARYLLTLDTPRGAIWLGDRFEHLGRPDLVLPGALAQLYGSVVLGQLVSARAVLARVLTLSTDPDVELFGAQLPVALLLADSAPAAQIRRDWSLATRALDAYPSAAGGAMVARRRAAWMLALLARRAGDTAAARRYRARLDDEPGVHPFATLVDADAEAAAGRPAAAITRTEPLLALDSAWQAGDPYFRAFLHLLRAQWHATAGSVTLALRDLRWHENSDLRKVGVTGAAPEAAEVDWSLGTLAQWRSARLLDASGGGAAACPLYSAVRRQWSGGDPPFAARADSAARRLGTLKCGEAP